MSYGLISGNSRGLGSHKHYLLDLSGLKYFGHRDLPGIWSASQTNLYVSRAISLNLLIFQSYTRTMIALLDDLVAPVLLWATFVDWIMNSVHQAERNIFPYHSPPVPILIIHETQTIAKKSQFHIHQYKTEDLAILNNHIKSNPKAITAAQLVGLKAFSMTGTLVSTWISGPIGVLPHNSLSKTDSFFTAKEIKTFIRQTPVLYYYRHF